MGLFSGRNKDQQFGELSGAVQALTKSTDNLERNITASMGELKKELKQEMHELRDELKEIDEKATTGSEASRQNTTAISSLQVQVKGVQGQIKAIEDDALKRAWMWPWLQKAMPILWLIVVVGGFVAATWIRAEITQIVKTGSRSATTPYQGEHYQRPGGS